MRKAALVLSLLFYAVSLTQPIAVGPQLSAENYPGGLALMLGWVSLMGATQPMWAGFSWLANPAYLFTLLSRRNPRNQKRWALAALGLAALFLAAREIPLNEGGDMTTISGMGAGYGLWVASIVLLNVYVQLRPTPTDATSEADSEG